MTKSKQLLAHLPADSLDVFVDGLVEKYSKRPVDQFPALANLPLIRFAAYYRFEKNKFTVATEADTDDITVEDQPEVDDVVGADEPAVSNASQYLIDTMPEEFPMSATMKAVRMKRARIVRYHRYDKQKFPSEYFYTLLHLFRPFQNEKDDLQLGDCNSWEELFEKEKDGLLDVIRQFELYSDVLAGAYAQMENAKEALETANQQPHYGGIAEDLVPLVNGDDGLAQHSLMLDDDELLDFDTNAFPDDVAERRGAPARDIELPPNRLSTADYHALLAERVPMLNAMQTVAFERIKERIDHWIECRRKFVPYLMSPLFVSGIGGTGKSWILEVARAYAHVTIAKGPTELITLTTATTGAASILVDGTTIHSALSILPQTADGYTPNGQLGMKAVTQRRNLYRHTAVFIIDEVSMCGSNLFHLSSQRLNQIYTVTDKRVIFGGLVTLLFGDLGQCPPVGQPKLFRDVTKGTVLRHLFNQATVMIELTELQRHKDDMAFAHMCKHIRMGQRMSIRAARQLKYTDAEYALLDGYTAADIAMRNSRTFKTLGIRNIHDPQLSDALFMFPTNLRVRQHNDMRIARMLSAGIDHAIVVAEDRFADEADSLKYDLAKRMPTDPKDTGSLMSSLTICAGLRIMIRRNIAITDKLANGSVGVVHSWDLKLNTVFVNMSPINGRPVGQATKAKWMVKHAAHHDVLSANENLIPITRDSTDVTDKNKHTLKMVRTQYPFVPAFAVSIHKTQGMTVDKAVISLTKAVKTNGLAYVAISRLKTLSGLFFLDFEPSCIHTDPQFISMMNILRQYSVDERPSFVAASAPNYDNLNAQFDRNVIPPPLPTARVTRRRNQPNLQTERPNVPTDGSLYKLNAEQMDCIHATINGQEDLVYPLEYADVDTTARYNGWLRAGAFDSFLNLLSFTSITDDTGIYRHTLTLGTEFSGRWLFCQDDRTDVQRLQSQCFADVISPQTMQNVSLITIPINYDSQHWAMTIVDVDNKTITYFDSSRYSRDLRCDQVLHRVRELMDHVYDRLQRQHVDWERISYPYNEQRDGHACGVFALAAAEQVVRAVDPNDFNQDFVRYYRWRIVLALTAQANMNLMF